VYNDISLEKRRPNEIFSNWHRLCGMDDSVFVDWRDVMDQNKFDLAEIVSEKMIKEFEKKLAKAIQDENWKEAASLESYISGMSQILIVFQSVEN